MVRSDIICNLEPHVIKVIGLLAKRSDITPNEFFNHWQTVHTALARQLPGLRRYTVNFIDRVKFPKSAFDGFSELWFDSHDAFEAAFASNAGEAVIDDIPKFIGELVRVVVEEHEIVQG